MHEIEKIIEDKRSEFERISDTIWEYAEIGFNEYHSSKLLKEYLASEEFRIIDNCGNLETAFMAEYGEGKPVIAFLGEYDALEGLSQKAEEYEKVPVEGKTTGHGCGHNCLAGGAVAATIGLKEYIKHHHLRCTIRFYGCPAEENGSGKSVMVRNGAFDGVDITFTWHPDDLNLSVTHTSLANAKYSFEFFGRSAHAALNPDKGRSALDAVELMNIGANYLREHMSSDARVHYAVTNTGGLEPNVVQAYAQVVYLIRANTEKTVKELTKRIDKIAQGAALMTETKMEKKYIKSCANLIPNATLQQLLYQKMKEVESPKYTKEELQQATKWQATFEEEDDYLDTIANKYSGDEKKDILHHREEQLKTLILPYREDNEPSLASTDVGDVSRICPVGQIGAVTWVANTPLHSWQAVAQGQSTIAHKGLIYAGKVLAIAALEVITNPRIRQETLDEWERRKYLFINEA